MPRSPTAPFEDGGFTPQSPTSPPPDVDSDTDDIYDSALAVARSRVSPEIWDAFSPDKKKACIDEQMQVLVNASESSPRG